MRQVRWGTAAVQRDSRPDRNCQVRVFLAYASAGGRTLLDRELYLPQVWAENWDRRREAGVPKSVSFHTKDQLA